MQLTQFKELFCRCLRKASQTRPVNFVLIQFNRQFDPESTGEIYLWEVRSLIFKLAEDNNPLGWFALRSDGGIRSVKLSAFRTELEHSAREKGYEPGEEMIDFTTLLVTLGLYTVGQNALPQDVKLKRKAELELLYQDAIARKLQAIIRSALSFPKFFGLVPCAHYVSSLVL